MAQTEDGGGSETRLGFAGVWSLAAGGMVGGGVYTALGVVVAVAGQWTWLAFVISGVLALTAAYGYVRLANHFERSGGAFEFLEEIGGESTAGALAWLLIVGYVLTMAVYAFAFGHYLAYAFDGGPWVMRGLAVGAMAALVGLNLMGTGSVERLEIVVVWSNLLILVGLGVYGLTQWDPVQLVAGIEPRPIWAAPFGAAAIFMAYEGFQLLTYEYGEIDRPKKVLMPALLTAVVFVIGVYVLVALGAVMLAGALPVVAEAQVALSLAAHEGLGTPGLVILTLAAGFATVAAINSTLFSTAKLARRVAESGELPAVLDTRNSHGVPARAVILLGTFAAALAIVGTLSTLVEAASLAFVFTFGVVNRLAAKHTDPPNWPSYTGMVLSVLVGGALVVRLAIRAPFSLGLLTALALLATVGRSWLLERVRTEGDDESA